MYFSSNIPFHSSIFIISYLFLKADMQGADTSYPDKIFHFWITLKEKKCLLTLRSTCDNAIFMLWCPISSLTFSLSLSLTHLHYQAHIHKYMHMVKYTHIQKYTWSYPTFSLSLSLYLTHTHIFYKGDIYTNICT